MNNNYRSLMGICALLAVCCTAGCRSHGTLPRHVSYSLEGLAAATLASKQLVYVDPGPAPQTQATVYALQRSILGWELALAPVRANLGANGVAPPWEKREGDRRTPSGIFPLRQAFGYPAALGSRVPYRQVGSQDLWVDDAQSPDYNRWVRRGETTAASFEELLRSDPLYRYALVPDYNNAPVVRGLGSAIFLHVERSAGAATSGCVSLPEDALLRLMEWLDPAARPQMVLGTAEDLKALAVGVGSQLPADLPAELSLRLQGGARLLAVRRGKTGAFFAAAVPLPPAVEGQLLAKKSWRPGCPVAPGELAYLVSSYWGFDGQPHYGELVVHAALCAFVLESLQSAYNARFPIERMELIEAFDADDGRSMEANNTSSFNCREVPGKPGVFSRHSYGAALDINPRQNPFLQIKSEALRARGWNGTGEASDFLTTLGFSGPSAAGTFCSHGPADCLVLPAGFSGLSAAGAFCRENPSDCLILPSASAPYLDRLDLRPGMLQPADAVLSAFKERGFVWGGSWRIPDYQHIDYDIRKLIAE